MTKEGSGVLVDRRQSGNITKRTSGMQFFLTINNTLNKIPFLDEYTPYEINEMHKIHEIHEIDL